MMKKFMILMCMILMTGNLTACGSVQEVSSEIQSAEEIETETIPETESISEEVPETSSETEIADEQLQIEETIPPEFESSDKDAEMIAMLEAQMQAVKDNDFEAFREAFDMDFMLEFHIAEGWEEDADALNQDMLDYFQDLCEDLPELQEIDIIQGSLTEWRIKNIDTLERGMMEYCTAVIGDTSYIAEFEVYISNDDQFAVLLDDIYHSVPVQGEETSPEPAFIDKDAELIAVIEAQMQAVRDNDFEAFWETFDMDFLIESSMKEGFEDSLEERDEEMHECFNDLRKEMLELQEIDTIQGSLTDLIIEDMDIMEYGVMADYTAVVKGTSYTVSFEMYASGDKFCALLDGWE